MSSQPADRRFGIPLTRRKAVAGGMIPKIEACVDVVERGVGSAHIISGKARNSLLFEVFTDEGSGTMVKDDAARVESTLLASKANGR